MTLAVCLGHTSAPTCGAAATLLNGRPDPTEDKWVPRASIALFLRTLANDYQEMLREDCIAAGARRGYAVSVFSADNDPDRQARQIRDCLASNEDARPTVV